MNRFIWVDAFTETRYGGNPCSVVFDADGISVEDRIAYTIETGLVECAFVVSSDRADFGARYYMPTGEILMAGHPTVATVTAMVDASMVDLSSGPVAFTLEVGAGVISIEVEPREERPPLVTMTQLRPVFARTYEAADIAALYGLNAADIVGAPQTVSTGSPFCITQIATTEALRRAKLDADGLEAFKAAVDADFMEPYLCVTEGADMGDTFDGCYCRHLFHQRTRSPGRRPGAWRHICMPTAPSERGSRRNRGMTWAGRGVQRWRFWAPVATLPALRSAGRA